MSIKIALAGNPNSGKTTLFNALTGSDQYVGNWPGVTVEKKDGRLAGHKDTVLQDLPGIYSLSPYSLEEKVSRNFLVYEKPDAILNIVDGTNIERNLYLSTQLAELGIPMVIAVNMMDIVDKAGDKIDFKKLGKALNCRAIGISAQKSRGCRDAAAEALLVAREGLKSEAPHVFSGSVEHALAHIEESIQGKVPAASIRWCAIKIFERDKEAIEKMGINPKTIEHVEGHIKDCEKELDDDAESIITSQRYEFIQKIVKDCVVKNSKRLKRMSISDKIDRIVTHKILALPIFILSLCAMWWLAVAENGPGTILTDWANDQFLGEDGWHLPFTSHKFKCPEKECENCTADERGENCTCESCRIYTGMEYEEAQEFYAPHEKNIEAWEAAYIEAYNEANKDKEGFEELAEMPEELDEALARTVKADGVRLDDDEETGEAVRGKLKDGCGPCIEVEIAEEDDEDAPELEWTCDWAMYQVSKAVPEVDPSNYGVFIPGISTLLDSMLDKAGVNETVKSLVKDGAWGGVATVLGFVPVILVVFLFLAFLEDCGYMARVAFIMDRLFRKFGLSGKSFIPMIVGKGCGVPAVMAARTIENERDHRMTVILATFIPCGAKTVIIAMFASIFFRDMWWVAALMDIIGIAIIVLGGIALKKSRAFAGEAAPFVMELPSYHLPTPNGIWRHTWTRVKGYVFKAGMIIFPACVFLWLVMHFDWSFTLLADEEIEKSILHDIGSWIAWFFAPLGFGTWQGAAASVSAEIAKEQATATLGIVAQNMQGTSTAAHIKALFGSMSDFPRLAAFSFMVFNLFIPPCMVAIAVTFREMGTKAWGWFAVAFQLFIGYTIALSAYQVGMLICSGVFTFWTILALAIDGFCLWAIFRPARKEIAK